ncbi:hypothetical protein EUTSA_v10015022mg [Eutrema salsugineum]|uniref:Uncharacterized protein n=1 Tax=Eutrema salsugineum TaxID=72664 RepID=V4LII8_EUTSA|nr:hypothetical protein EUTSA_v10015022mg [Eutrema salsugineum]
MGPSRLYPYSFSASSSKFLNKGWFNSFVFTTILCSVGPTYTVKHPCGGGESLLIFTFDSLFLASSTRTEPFQDLLFLIEALVEELVCLKDFIFLHVFIIGFSICGDQIQESRIRRKCVVGQASFI